jgi:hypothetical protein
MECLPAIINTNDFGLAVVIVALVALVAPLETII